QSKPSLCPPNRQNRRDLLRLVKSSQLLFILWFTDCVDRKTEGVMRGFVVLFDTQPQLPQFEGDDAVGRRLRKWQLSLCPTGLTTLRLERCQFYLFSANKAIPTEFNQVTHQTPTELLLWIGPRVDITDAELLKGPTLHNLKDLALTTLTAPSVLDTALF